jgi:CHASE2 domain-containing sensor protein
MDGDPGARHIAGDRFVARRADPAVRQSAVRPADRLRAPPADDRILIVAIDNDSLRRIGRWPWGRETHAALLDRLAAAHPRAIAYDVLFTEPNPADPALAAAMTRAKPVFAPLLFETPGLNGRGL